MQEIFTVGHSNRSLESFLAIRKAHGIARILDIRRFPGSRKWPHFGAAELERSLPAASLGYVGLPELGGRRPAHPDSPHTSWRNPGFRGYADFMDTPAFAEELAKAMALAEEMPSALMCAEALPWRCHRSLVADALDARGWRVWDILSEVEAREHRLPAFARPRGTRVLYDGPPRQGRRTMTILI